MCRDIIHSMGGTISVESTLGEGSTFTFKVVSQKCDWDSSSSFVVSKWLLKIFRSKINNIFYDSSQKR